MSDHDLQPVDPTVDPYGYIRFTPNPDGSATRLPFPVPVIPAESDPDTSSPVLTKDFPINESKNTWLRLYVPRQALDSSSKLPFIVHFHGGAFVLFSAATVVFHTFCTTVAAGILAVIASVEYRLAPENRLPAAYDDAMEALDWIKTTREEWFVNFVDLSNCVLTGDSAGANIAYNVGLRVAEATEDPLERLNIKGLILHHPFFGGTERTESETRLVNDQILPPVATDLMWELALPVGVDRDHEYCNPTINGGSDLCENMAVLGWKVLLDGVDGDPVFDRQVEFGKMLEEKGVEVVRNFGEGGQHGADVMDPSKTGHWSLLSKSSCLLSLQIRVWIGLVE